MFLTISNSKIFTHLYFSNLLYLNQLFKNKMNNDNIKSIFNQGVKLGPNVNKDRYICPVTGAHFEWRDMCRRLEPIA